MNLPLGYFDQLGQLSPEKHPVLYPAAAATTLAVAVGVAAWFATRKRVSAAELEERRRHLLASVGRIVDGTVIGVDPDENDPCTVFYTYRVAGVTYECAQDISVLPARVYNVRLDTPVQVRYLRANPGNSIVVEETWNGLWSADQDEAAAVAPES